MSLEHLARSQLLLFYVLLRIVESDISYTPSSLSNKLLEKQVISRGLHVVTICLYETLDLLHLKIITILLHQLGEDFYVNRDGMQTNYYSTIVLHIDLGVPFMPSYIINFNSCCRICIKYLSHEVAALGADKWWNLVVCVQDFFVQQISIRVLKW